MQLHKNMSNSLTLQNYPIDFEDVNKKKTGFPGLYSYRVPSSCLNIFTTKAPQVQHKGKLCENQREIFVIYNTVNPFPKIRRRMMTNPTRIR